MQDRSNLITGVSVAVCLLFLTLALYFHSNIKKTQTQFDVKKASYTKEGLELKGRLDALQEALSNKIGSATILEDEKLELSQKIENLKKENDNILTSFRGQLDTLKKSNALLRRKIADLENTPIIKRINESLESEQSVEIKKVLEEAAGTIERIQTEKSGKSVNLEQIVVSQQDLEDTLSEGGQFEMPAGQLKAAPSAGSMADNPAEKRGTILTIDKKNSLIVTSLGRKEGLKEGGRLKILKKDQHIATAEVISARYRISAATVDDIKYKYKITDIKEGDQVVLIES